MLKKNYFFSQFVVLFRPQLLKYFFSDELKVMKIFKHFCIDFNVFKVEKLIQNNQKSGWLFE